MKGKWLIAGALILVEVALCGLISASLWASAGLFGDLRFNLGDWRPNTHSVTETEELNFSVDDDVTLNVNQDTDFAVGNVTVIGGSGDEVLVTAEKVAWGADEAEATAALDELKLVASESNNTVTVNVQRPRDSINLGEERTSRVNLTITVPVNTTVNIDSEFGDISVTGVEGDATVNNGFGNVDLSGIRGGDIDLDVSFGETRLDDVNAKDILINSNAGEIHLTDVEATGQVDINSDFGEVRFQDGSAGSVEATTQGGEVRLADLTVDGALFGKSDFGNVEVDDVTAESYDLQTNSGAITVNGAEGEIVAHTDFGNITISSAVDATLNLSTNSGAIEFSGSLGLGPHDVSTDFGGVVLRIPDTSELDIDFSTDFGGIDSDLPVTLKGGQDNNHWVGTINGGGASLTVKTNSGTITIESLNP